MEPNQLQELVQKLVREQYTLRRIVKYLRVKHNYETTEQQLLALVVNATSTRATMGQAS
jgi:hypothetical protein